MSVSVLVPFRGDGGERDRIWGWMRQRWEQAMPEAELVVAGDNHDDPARFNEGQAFNRAAAAAEGDIFLIAETEVAFNASDLDGAIDHVWATGDWMIAERYHQLAKMDTQKILAQDPSVPLTEPKVVERSFIRESVSSILVVPAEAYRLVGGYDERYPGWGHIDKAFAYAMNTLYRPYERFAGSMFHLWHPRTESIDSNPELTRRYREADGNPDAMRAIITER